MWWWFVRDLWGWIRGNNRGFNRGVIFGVILKRALSWLRTYRFSTTNNGFLLRRWIVGHVCKTQVSTSKTRGCETARDRQILNNNWFTLNEMPRTAIRKIIRKRKQIRKKLKKGTSQNNNDNNIQQVKKQQLKTLMNPLMLGFNHQQYVDLWIGDKIFPKGKKLGEM